MDNRTARAYLSHICEPDDAYVGRLLELLTPSEVLQCLADGAGGPKYPPRMTLGDDAAVTAWLQALQQRTGVHFLIPGDENYPVQLADLGPRAPFGLWVRGNPYAVGQLDRGRAVALVGARAATSYGDNIALTLASELAQAGIPVVSGAAYGIDAAAHRGALLADGTTIAFLAGGADRPYPAGNSHLIADIARTGAVVSEVPPGSAPTKWRFLARNRLIAAASEALVVVEAGVRSGSLNAARHAVELQRKLGAVPGPVTSATSAGTHRLVREMGATLITDTDDVRELLSLPRTAPAVVPLTDRDYGFAS